MELHATTIDEEAARLKFREYRDAVRKNHDEEDAQIMRGYREVVRGHQVISLTATLRAGGRDARGLPNLAVARADAVECWIESCTYGGFLRLVTKKRWDGRSGNNKKDVRQFPAGTLPKFPMPDPTRNSWDTEGSQVMDQHAITEYRAIVPIVPPALRPAHSLANYDILWECEWRRAPRPPVDPALLKHIGGDLYAVMAVWDLTDLERLVLQGRSST